MRNKKFSFIRKDFLVLGFFLLIISVNQIDKYLTHSILLENQEPVLNNKQISTKIKANLENNVDPKNSMEIDDLKLGFNYSFDKKLDDYVEKILRRYRSDYSSIVVIDNNTGHILSALDYEKKTGQINRKLSLSNTHPAASIFKLITTAELLENKNFEKNEEIKFKGKTTTLYKYQLKSAKGRWTRTHSLDKAFATSNNVYFGKAAIENMEAQELYDMAHKFGFDQLKLKEVGMIMGKTFLPESSYELAEMASGFNRETQISPIMGAVIASIIMNSGQLITPTFVKRIYDLEDGETLWFSKGDVKQIISPESAKKIEDMMRLTVRKGTARGSFRRFLRKYGDKVEIGGKTGSITGGKPFGKRDWFIAYIKSKNSPLDKGISLCIMNINVKKWYVRSTFLAQKIMEHYIKERVE